MLEVDVGHQLQERQQAGHIFSLATGSRKEPVSQSGSSRRSRDFQQEDEDGDEDAGVRGKHMRFNFSV